MVLVIFHCRQYSLVKQCHVSYRFLTFFVPLDAKMARYLTQKQIDEFRECFSLYDKKKQNRIGVRDVITVMRSLGTYPTRREIEAHLKTYDKKHGDDVEFSTFLSIM